MVVNKIKNLEHIIEHDGSYESFKETIDSMDNVPIYLQMNMIAKNQSDFLSYLIYQDKLHPISYALSGAMDTKVKNIIKGKKLLKNE